MRRIVPSSALVAVVVAVVVEFGAARPAASAETLNVKPGAWETTVATSISSKGVPDDVLAKMTPEERARLEKQMSQMAGKPLTTTRKTCVTKDDLANNRFLAREERNCTVTPTTQTARKLVATRTCNATVPPSISTLTFEAASPERVHGTVDMTAEGRPNLHVEVDAHWLTASCDGIEPAMPGPKPR